MPAKKVKKTLKNEVWHLMGGVVVAIFSYVLFSNILLSILSFLSSLIIDIDHLLEYFLAEGLNFRGFVGKFLSGENFSKIGKIYVIFHAWEYIPFLFFISYLTSKPVFIAVSLGLSVHYLVDTLTNKVKSQTYFLTYRIYHNFNLKNLES